MTFLKFERRALRGGRVISCLLALGAASCSGSLESPAGSTGTAGTSAVPGVPGDPGAGTAGAAGVMNPPVVVDPANPGLDVNRVGIHRLNKVEYDNTIKDLFGVATTPATTFSPDEVADGFDNIASAFGMTEAQFEQYYNAADTVVEGVFLDAALAARIMTCTPASAADTACIGQIISAFGARAWRRPLDAAEVTRLTQVVTDAMALGEDALGGIKQVVKTMLASVPFLYRLEIDPDPAALAPRALNGYELASRLSYLGWSTMPDDAMFALAQSGALLTDATLEAEVDRMLASPKAEQFVSSFAGQWLGLRKLQETHTVNATIFPTFSEPLRTAMVQEGMMFFKEFLHGTRQMTEFFTADVNFVDSALSQHYGMPAAGAGTTMVNNTTDTRVGFLGLASFLTFTSFDYRTAPTLRGKWVLENLLCQSIPAPPATVPELDDPGADPVALQSENVRVRLEAHRDMEPACANCHQMLDPIGLGLENYDAIGAYRTEYDNGDLIDASGQLGTATFNGLQELAVLLSADTRLTDCVSDRLMTYALSRQLAPTDEPYLQQVREKWAASGGYGLKPLLKAIVLNDTFRFRRGETGVAQ